jgi:hypothetical protein
VTAGAAAAAGDSAKQRAYRRPFSALPFVPLSVESLGRLGAPAVLLLGCLASTVAQAGRPGLSRPDFILWALRYPGSASLCQGCTMPRPPLVGPRCAGSLGLELGLLGAAWCLFLSPCGACLFGAGLVLGFLALIFTAFVLLCLGFPCVGAAWLVPCPSL